MRGITASGYVIRRVVLEHIYLAEQALGKPLPPKARVHHVDGNKLNNAHSNLVVCESDGYHQFLHMRTRVVKAGGNPNSHVICCRCKALLPFSAFTSNKRRVNGLKTICIECGKSYRREWSARKRQAA